MQGASVFEKLVAAGNPVGEIIGIDSFMVSVKGLQPTNVHATVRFDDDTRGYVHQVLEDHVVVMKLDPSPLHVGSVCVIEKPDIMTPVGKNFIGRVVNVFGERAGAQPDQQNVSRPGRITHQQTGHHFSCIGQL